MPEVHTSALSAPPTPLRLSTVLPSGSKSHVRVGHTSCGQDVIVKQLTNPTDQWTPLWDRELAVYRECAINPPEVRFPQLLDSGPHQMVLERLPGRMLAPTRFLQEPLPQKTIDAVLTAFARLSRWRPGQAVSAPVFDYTKRTTQYLDMGYLKGSDAAALRRLLASPELPWAINHGDPIPTNIMVDDSGDVALIDCEYTGGFLAGLDLAVLHMVSAPADTMLRRRIEHVVESHNLQVPYTINMATVLVREVYNHDVLPADHLERVALPAVQALWDQAREQLHRVAARPTASLAPA